MPRASREWLILLGVLLGALVLFHDGLVWGSYVLAGGDLTNYDIPHRTYWLRSGFWTGWYAPSFSGYPLFANIQHAALYPFNWLYWMGLPPQHTVTWLVLLHLLIGGAGFFRFCRERLAFQASLVGAFLWMSGGYVTLRLTQGVIVFPLSLAWFPWMWWCVERLDPGQWRWAARLALLGALQFLAGSPQLVHITWGGLAIWMLGRIIAERGKRARLLLAGQFLAAGVGSLVIVLPQLIATSRLTRMAFGRGADGQWEFLTNDSLLPRMLLTYIVPEFFTPGNLEGAYWGSRTGYHEVNAYIGAAALVLALFAGIMLVRRMMRRGDEATEPWEKRWLLVLLSLCVVGIVVGLGKYTPLYKLLYHTVPGFGLFRVPARWVLWWYAPVCLFAAWGFHLLQELGVPHRPAAPRGVLVAWLAAAAVFLLPLAAMLAAVEPTMNLVGFKYYDFSYLRDELGTPFVHDNIVGIARDSITWALGMVAVAAVLGTALLARRLGPRIALAGIALLLVGDLFRFWLSYREPFPLEYLKSEIPTEAAHHKIDADFFDEYFYPGTVLVSRLRNLQPGRILYTDDMIHNLYDQLTREFYAERPAIHGFENMRGYQPLQIRNYVMEYYRMFSDDPDFQIPANAFLVLPLVNHRWPMDAFNATHLLTYASAEGGPEYTNHLRELGLEFADSVPVSANLELHIWRNPHAAGWAWLSAQKEWPGLDERIDGVELRDLVREPDVTTFTIDAPAPGLALHFAEYEFPGWTITAMKEDKEANQWWRVRSEGRSITLPNAGEWHIERRYRLPAGTRATLPLAAVAALVVLGAAIPLRRRRPAA